MGVRVRLFRGSSQNLKVTTEEDLALAEALLRMRRPKRREPGITPPDSLPS